MAEAQRKEPRIAATFRVRYGTLDQLVVAWSNDLSRGGMFLATTRFVPVNAVLRVHIEMPQLGRVLSAIARVAFVRDEDEALETRQPAGMGVEFLDVSQDDVAAIGRFLTEHSVAASEDSGPVRTRPLDIVIVDDERDLREMTAIPLRARGDHLRLAQNGVEALALCLRRRPDVILADIAMPIMDGWQFLRVIRGRPSLASVPVAFVTALLTEEDRLHGYQLGVDDYIAKPFSPSELVARTDRLVARSVRSGGIERKTLRGALEHVPLSSVLSFLEMEKQTGVLLVLRDHRAARIFFRDGAILRVEVERATTMAKPVQMLHYVLSWPTGEFEFAAQDVSGPDEVQTPITALLMEHARLHDEMRRPK